MMVAMVAMTTQGKEEHNYFDFKLTSSRVDFVQGNRLILVTGSILSLMG